MEVIGGLEIRVSMRAADEPRKTKLNSYSLREPGERTKSSSPGFAAISVRLAC
jgi:hypothetical protein